MSRAAHSILTVLVMICLAACSRESAESPAISQAPPPTPAQNLVVICIDTVSATNFFSPLIEDELTVWLESAQQYVDASSAAPWTIPSVASTLTGLYPVQHQAGVFAASPANLNVDLPSALPAEAETLAEMLTASGISTAAFSAHPWFEADFGFDQGFEQLHLRRGWMNVTDLFQQWLGDLQPGERFFGYLHFMEAHDWHAKPRERLTARLEGLDPELLDALRADSAAAACKNPDEKMCLRNMVYNLAIRDMRTAIAATLQDLQERGQLSDTLVLVYSDHGEEFWQHKQEHEQRGDQRGFYGYGHGHSLYQEMLNVPLLAWHPNVPGARQDSPVSLIDVVPSTLQWLGLDREAYALPGRLLPLGPGASTGVTTERSLFASGIAYGSEAVASREGHEKSILYLQDQRFELYDLSTDPDERYPLQENGRIMRADVLTGDYLDLASQSLAYRPELDEAQLEKLKSIGYLQGVDELPQTGRPVENAEPAPGEDEER